MEYVGTASDGTTKRYRDAKRWMWLVAFALPIVPLTAFAQYYADGRNPIYLTLPLIYFFGLVPILDLVIGGDTHNPPEEVVPAMENDRFFARLACLLIPFHFILFFATTYIVATNNLPWWAIAALVIGIGSINGNLINIGHELGHKMGRASQFFTRGAFALSGYGHFTVEHNRGHHVRVSTPEDCASSRMGESVYAFALRELPGAFFGGWELEKKRLATKGLPAFHWRNEILQVYLACIVINAAVVAWLGLGVLPFVLAHHFISWYALTQVNYIEHYGLLRQKRANGKYEPCAPRHSWNSNHLVSNLISLHLQRHSDHHANPMRPYQALRDFDDVPTLPVGYSGCLVLAAIPPLWFRVMDPRVKAWADGDLSKVNMCPKARHRYLGKEVVAA